MSDASKSADALNECISRLTMISAEFVNQTGKAPSLDELLSILGWASFGIYPEPLKFAAKLKRNRRYKAPSSSLVGELGDSIFADAASFMAAMAEGVHGHPLSPSELASSLAVTIGSSNIPLEDVAGDEITELTTHASKKISKPKIGDVLAVPASAGEYYLAAVVARNRFGTALGFLRGRFRVPRPVSEERIAVYRFPIYTDDRLVATGQWKVVGHDEKLLSLFPAEPEIYHSPDLQWPGVDLGEFGAAEKATGEIRLIGLDEARQVGLLDGTYQQSYLGESVGKVIADSGESY
ncbi:hypothetical protein ACFZAV_43020 [Streptomyces sp. NPDC008343]|uniref:hypothetical protein n=1 Tax=Streptomyces sp. NPDC008343 TaxID=3364828 RepID=UPI0036EEEFF4